MFLLSVAVLAQSQSQDPLCDIYNKCQSDVKLTWQLTCNDVIRRNATWGPICQCYYQVEVGKCYIQCPTDPTIVAEGNAQKPAITAACSPVNLNPNALPLAPWVTLSTTVAPTATSKPATASSTASATAKSNSALSAGVENSFLAMLLALVV